MSLLTKITTQIAIWSSKSLTYALFPQTIKAFEVKITGQDGDTKFLLGDDGEKYVKRTVVCKKHVKFSNGQTFKKGDEVYFKVEPIEWVVAGHPYHDVETKRGSKYEKIENRRTIYSKKVLDVYGQSLENLLISTEESEKFGRLSVNVPSTVASLEGAMSRNGRIGTVFKFARIRKFTDFALAGGLGHKGKHAYHTYMSSNNQLIIPTGGSKEKPKNVIPGETLFAVLDLNTPLAEKVH